jgi:hypothetical protein
MSGIRRLSMAAIGMVTLTGCMESIGQPLPLREAQWMPTPYPLYEAGPALAGHPPRRVHADGRVWVGYDAPHDFHGADHGTVIPADKLVAVGTVEGTALYALAWDAPPFGRLYAPLGEGRWRVYQPLTR